MALDVHAVFGDEWVLELLLEARSMGGVLLSGNAQKVLKFMGPIFRAVISAAHVEHGLAERVDVGLQVITTFFGVVLARDDFRYNTTCFI